MDKQWLFDKELLNQIRSRFANIESDSIGGNRVYLENSGGSLRLKSVIKATTEFTALPDNTGRVGATSKYVDQVISKGLKDIKLFLGADSGIVAIGESTTSNMFKILTPIISNIPGNNVVTTNLDHPSCYDSTKIVAQRYKKEWRVVGLFPSKCIVDSEEVLKCIDKETIVLAIIHSSNILGTRNDLKKIIMLAKQKKPELYVIADGSQYCMHSLIDVKDIGCDVYLASSYKSFNKVGAAAIYLSERASFLSHDKLEGKPANYWELGTREVAGYAGWSAVIDYLCWLGAQFKQSGDKRELIVAAMKAIDAHERGLVYLMLYGGPGRKGLLDLKSVTVYGETKDLSIKDSTFLFNVKHMSSAEVVRVLGEHKIRVSNRINDAYSAHTLKALGIEEGVRVSAAHYNSPEEINEFLKALEEIAQ